MSAKILLSILALGGVGMVALPADVLQKPNSQPVASRLDKTEPTQQVASLQPPVAVSTGQAANTATAAETPAAATPAFPPANAELATVGDSNLNARQGPATSFAKVFVVAAGEQLQVIDKNGMWVQVRRNTGESGWVHSSYLSGGERATSSSTVSTERRVATTDPQQQDDATPSRRATLGAGSVLFSGPSRSSQAIFKVEAGERLRIGERRGNWVRVVTSQGFSGWLLVR